jgi:putative ABC transport system permease protein
MLRLEKIKKDYRVADYTVNALKGVSLSFRKNEFVAVLGPSGCGKTTLLNLVGGLDRATRGDLVINDRSTKDYKDRDWDVYRNHRIGFIFQSYNLIPHQTVLSNVELALTIAGVSKAERIERAKRALDKVGLSDQYHKRPNQLSGGQSQRVAIARALVNDPEILLADEPTGALDTVTSVQILDLIKEIASERLVIMVTHNAELAEKYATRIVRLLDGNLLSDTNPYGDASEERTTRDYANAPSRTFGAHSEISVSDSKPFAMAENTVKTDISKNETAEVKAYPHCHHGLAEEIKICPHCGKNLDEKAEMPKLPKGFWRVFAGIVGIQIFTLLSWFKVSASGVSFSLFNVWGDLDYIIWSFSLLQGIRVIAIILSFLLASSFILLLISMIGYKSKNRIRSAYCGFGLFALTSATFIVLMLSIGRKTDGELVLTVFPYLALALALFAIIFLVKTPSFLVKFKQSLKRRKDKTPANRTAKTAKHSGKRERAKMSFFTAFRLSLQNLFSKRRRTVLTSIASSIGIIGISLVLAFSYGVQTYIAHMQNDMLSGNPITVTETAFNLSVLAGRTHNHETIGIMRENGFVNVDGMIESIARRASLTNEFIAHNNITQEYVDYLLAMPKDIAAAVFLDYGIDITNNLYMDFYEKAGGETQNISLSALREIYTSILKLNESTKDYASLVMSLSDTFIQAPDSEEYIRTQYNIIDGGRVAKEKHEVMIVLDNDNMLTDLLLVQLGYYSQEEFVNQIFNVTEDGNYNSGISYKDRFSFEELKGRTFTWYPNDTVYRKNTNPFTNRLNPFFYNAYSDDFTSKDGGIELEIVGILEPKENISYGCLMSGFYFTEALTEHIIRENIKSEIVEYLNDNDSDTVTSTRYEVAEGVWMNVGVTFNYSFNYLGARHDDVGFLGRTNPMMGMMAGMMGMTVEDAYVISIRELGGRDIANFISIYPPDLEQKRLTLQYLRAWNTEGEFSYHNQKGEKIELGTLEERGGQIIFSDPLTIIFRMIGTVIDMITIALIGFTSLALFVSCVMIAIITYISVVERVKEIGVIRSLGGRKRDVSRLFIAETAIIGLAAGIIAITFTYIASFFINLATQAAGDITIAIFPATYAVYMVCLSIFLTLISGFFPSRSAAKKDPVVALRTE